MVILCRRSYCGVSIRLFALIGSEKESNDLCAGAAIVRRWSASIDTSKYYGQLYKYSAPQPPPPFVNTLLVNSYYPPPTQSPFTNQSCLAQFKLRRSASRRYWVGKCSKFFPSSSGSSWGVSTLLKRFVLCEQQVSLCRTRRLCLDCCFFIDIILRLTIYVDYHRNLEYTAICC